MAKKKSSTTMIPEENLKNMTPEEIVAANEDSQRLEKKGVPDDQAIDTALKWARRLKDRDRVPKGAAQ
jgi:hypothetical protein